MSNGFELFWLHKLNEVQSLTLALIVLSTDTVQSDLIESMTKLLQAQTQMLTAQALAVMVQTLPPLTRYNGEESQNEDNTFDWWIKRFEEQACLAKWNDDKSCTNLKPTLKRQPNKFLK